MKSFKMYAFLFGAVLFCATAIYAADAPLVKSGTGERTKSILGTVYVGTLYVTQDLIGKSGNEIVDADKAMNVILKVDTVMLSREKFVASVSEGFDVSASSGYGTDKKQTFLNLFGSIEFKKGDIVTFEYLPSKGTSVTFKEKASGNVRQLGMVPSLQFKKALFAIWIGPKPVQESLKKSMLGK